MAIDPNEAPPYRSWLIRDFDCYHYVPVLYSRAAELNAVRQLEAAEAGALTPLWVIPPVTTDPETGEKKKSLEAHVRNVAKGIMKAWGDEPCFVDTHQLCESEGHPSGLAEATLNWLAEGGLRIVPVIRDVSPVHQQAEVADFAASRNTDVCFRLSAALWADLGTATGDAALADLITLARCGPEDVHLVIDLGDQVSDPPKISAVAVRGALAGLVRIDSWRTLTLLGTSMPSSTADVGRNNAAEISRSEWGMWKLLREGRGRRMTFGDYAVQSTDVLSTFNPRYMQTAAQLRYTISSAWFVARGASTRLAGFSQSSELAAQITQHSEFSGRDFSPGDKWIADRAVKATGPGNATTWRMASTSHHLVFVLRQLANLRGR